MRRRLALSAIVMSLGGCERVSVDRKPTETPTVTEAPERIRATADGPALLRALERLPLPRGTDLALDPRLHSGAVLSRPLSPREGLALWRLVQRHIDRDEVQAVLLNRAYHDAVLAGRGTAPAPDLASERRRADALRFPDHFAALEAERRREERELIAKYGGDDLLESERRKLAALPATTAPRPGAPDDFSFVSIREMLLESARQQGWDGAELTLAREHEVRLFVASLRPGDVPLVLGYGHWNECPEAAVHGALLAHWREAYGAHLTFVGGDTLEFTVERPPADVAAAKPLAWNQFLYCADIVTQGTGSVADLATTLAGDRRWFFWWD